MTSGVPLDLVLLVADRDAHEALDALLSERRPSLGVRNIRYEILGHPRHDPGCFHEAPALLQTFQARALHALVIFDHEGSGQDHRPPAEVEEDLRRQLSISGWGDRSEVLLVVPELEAWVWSDSPEVDAALGWEGRSPRLREWMADSRLWPSSDPKPPRPKEGFLAALREARIRRSASIYRQLAERVGLKRCEDPSFARLKAILCTWFPAEGAA